MRARNEELWVEWANRVRRWGESGLTAAEFAQEIGVDAKALTMWKWKLRKEQKRAVGSVVSPSADSASAAPALRLVPSAAANGVTLRVTKDFDEATLLRVVTLLGGKA